VRRITIVAVAVAASAGLLAGCAAGPTIKSTVGAGSPFCTDLAKFAGENAPLADAAAETPPALVQSLSPLEALLKQMLKEVPSADTVNTKPIKADVQTVVNVYADVISALQQPGVTVKAAVNAVNKKEGQTLTDAAGRLDAYAGKVCSVSTTTTVAPPTTAGPTTTAAPVGPTAPPTTAASGTSTSGP
jgi:hypothetical protein